MGLEKIKEYFVPKSILDIGANTGQFFANIKAIFPEASFLLIEGNDHCELALKTLDTPYIIALLSDKVKDVDFYLRKGEPNCTGNSIYRENSAFYADGQIEIERKTTKTLSSVLNEGDVFDLIKIDVQGSELDIINGGIDIIKKAKGVILEVSLVEFNIDSPTQEVTYEFMRNLGFEPVEILEDLGHPITHVLIQQDVLFINQNIDL